MIVRIGSIVQYQCHFQYYVQSSKTIADYSTLESDEIGSMRKICILLAQHLILAIWNCLISYQPRSQCN